MFIPGIWFCTIVFLLKLTWQLITINVFSFFKYKIQLTRSMSETSDPDILRNSRLVPDLISFWNCCPSRIIPFEISRLFSVLQWMTILRSPSTLIPFMVDSIFSVVRNFKSHIQFTELSEHKRTVVNPQLWQNRCNIQNSTNISICKLGMSHI